ncbi:MAG TPA: YciI family protein [Aliidongia sp.]|nr:YciI family protein [Aliidongia sp.]
MTDDVPDHFVLIHAPGPAWKPGVPFREQHEVMEHVRYMRQFLDSGALVMGGPFLDDSGGMMIMRGPSLDAATALAEADPTVGSGLLTVTVRPWLPVMQGER